MRALVLSRRDWREADQLITLYSEAHGKIELIARGIKKSISKNSSSLLPGTLVEIEVVGGKEFRYLTTADPVDIFSSIRGRLDKSAITLVVLGWVEKLVGTGEPDNKIFLLLGTFLETLNAAADAPRHVLTAFLIKLLELLGVAPELEACVVCGKDDKKTAYLSVKSGGMVCLNCLRTTPHVLLTDESMRYLRGLRATSWPALFAQTINKDNRVEVENFSIAFAEFHTQHQLSRLNSVDNLFDE